MCVLITEWNENQFWGCEIKNIEKKPSGSVKVSTTAFKWPGLWIWTEHWTGSDFSAFSYFLDSRHIHISQVRKTIASLHSQGGILINNGALLPETLNGKTGPRKNNEGIRVFITVIYHLLLLTASKALTKEKNR